MTAIRKRTLGNTEIRISPIGLGCWQFSNGNGLVGKFWPDMEQSAINKVVRESLDGGINWFDTAEVYGKGNSERALNDALDAVQKEDEEALIATKWWPAFRRSSSIINTFEERRIALGGRHVDLHQVHQPFSFSSPADEMHAMADLMDEGKIGSAGVSNFNLKQMKEAHETLQERGYGLASNQVKYSLLDRRIEENGILDYAKEQNITIIAYSPLEQGILSGKYHRNPDLVKKIQGPRKLAPNFRPKGMKRTEPLITLMRRLAEDYDVSPTQIALNWLIHQHGDTVVAIPGASKTHHATENIRTMQFELSSTDLFALDQMAKRVVEKQ
ncbi:aldo/keto reductase [Salisediminibacterium selenitireducens]|uniref:Aldo/keto reductase n=1 Tax=Bacillus selenitireducens (strain ATCC 700615 / DSM 15326 / MLS10) TaxID=439292 RepID=D6XWR2_BACIE|nr:aldo/keto reductase [Salisediminibacterium selenitireducens]ADH97904.1 aldo/keto reductase [[Bacillus] selenitireducens MLS10]